MRKSFVTRHRAKRWARYGRLVATATVCSMQAAVAQQNDDTGPVIYATEAPGVVRIHAVGVKADGSMDGEDGSGFVISRSGYVLTASHVIPDDAKYTTLILGVHSVRQQRMQSRPVSNSSSGAIPTTWRCSGSSRRPRVLRSFL